MSIFKKKKPEPAPEPYIAPDPCTVFGHIWRDFPCYLDPTYNGKKGYRNCIDIVESYVCCRCGKRKDIVLDEIDYPDKLSYNQFKAEMESLKVEYGAFIQPRALVEDMIHDQQLIDREKLRILDQMHGDDAAAEPFKFTLGGEKL